MQKAFEYAKRWRVSSMWPEAVTEGLPLLEDLQQVVMFKDTKMAGCDYFPAVRPLNVGMANKTVKIASLAPLMENDLVKLPWHLKNEGFFRRLWEQFAGFYPDANDAGLEKDDEIDTVQMHRFVFKGLPTIEGGEGQQVGVAEQIKDKIESGESRDEFGFSLWQKAMRHLSPEELIQLAQHHRAEEEEGWF